MTRVRVEPRSYDLAVAYAGFFNGVGVSKTTSNVCSRSILWRIYNFVQCHAMESKSHSA